MIAYVVSSDFGGSAGSTTIVYIVDANNHWHDSFSGLTYGHMAILSTMHDGYFDIANIGFENGPDSRKGLLVYKWTRGGYTYSHQLNLTEKELEALDEQL